MNKMGGVATVTNSKSDMKPEENMLLDQLNNEDLLKQIDSDLIQNKGTTIVKLLNNTTSYDPTEKEIILSFLNQLMAQNRLLHQKVDNKNQVISTILCELEREKRTFTNKTLEPHAQILFSFLLGLQALENEIISDKAKNYLITLKSEVKNQLDELHKSLMNLYPLSINDLGAIGSVKSYYDYCFDNKELNVNVTFHGQLKRHEEKLEIQLFRFVQFFITLIDKKTNTTNLKITFQESEDMIQLTFVGNAPSDTITKIPEYQLFQEKIDYIAKRYTILNLQDHFQIELDIAKDNHFIMNCNKMKCT